MDLKLTEREHLRVKRHLLGTLVLVSTVLGACEQRKSGETAGNNERSSGDNTADSVLERAAECKQSSDCDDGVSCTEDRCIGGLCMATPNHAACDDGQVCDYQLGCQDGKACADDAECDDDDGCTVNERCNPATRTCLYDVLDGDQDGFPPVVCGGEDCDDSRSRIPQVLDVTCDNVDDDCDGRIDDDLDFESDPDNCGGCDIRCETGACKNGECVDCGDLGQPCCSGNVCNKGACDDGECAKRTCDAVTAPEQDQDSPPCSFEFRECIEQCTATSSNCVDNCESQFSPSTVCLSCVRAALVECASDDCKQQFNALSCCYEDQCDGQTPVPGGSFCAGCFEVEQLATFCMLDSSCAQDAESLMQTADGCFAAEPVKPGLMDPVNVLVGDGVDCSDTVAAPKDNALITDYEGLSAPDQNFTGGLDGATVAYYNTDTNLDPDASLSFKMSSGPSSDNAAQLIVTNTETWGGGLVLHFIGSCVDASSYSGVTFWARGVTPSGQVRVVLQMDKTNPSTLGGQCENEPCRAPLATIAISEDWGRYSIAWKDFAGGSSGEEKDIAGRAEAITSLTFMVDNDYERHTVELVLDDVAFLE